MSPKELLVWNEIQNMIAKHEGKTPPTHDLQLLAIIALYGLRFFRIWPHILRRVFALSQ